MAQKVKNKPAKRTMFRIFGGGRHMRFGRMDADVVVQVSVGVDPFNGAVGENAEQFRTVTAATDIGGSDIPMYVLKSMAVEIERLNDELAECKRFVADNLPGMTIEPTYTDGYTEPEVEGEEVTPVTP